MAHEETIPTSLWTALDGYDVGRGFDRACPTCEREHAPGDRLVVTTERASEAADWELPSIVCSECGRQSFSEDERQPAIDQALVSVEIAPAAMALVLDADSARLLDRSPRTRT
jgi:hypothetical protein